MILARALLAAAGVYFVIGLLFALAFVSVGMARIDRRAQHGSIGFRLLLLPGAALLWPLLARRWIRGQQEAP